MSTERLRPVQYYRHRQALSPIRYFRYRSAITGRFVTPQFAGSNPHTTMKEAVH